MSVASKTLINKLAKNFIRCGGIMINNPEGWDYLDKREAEAITLNEHTIIIRQKISISALIEELEHAEQYRKGAIDVHKYCLLVVNSQILHYKIWEYCYLLYV